MATPAGIGALGIIRLSGPDAVSIACSFVNLKSESFPPREALLARAFWEGEFLDQVIVVYYPSMSSPTGENLIEITTHGSPFILKRVLKSCIKFGARLAEPGEFTKRAFVNGRMDLAQAEAVCDLIRAETSAAHRAAATQLEGGISKIIRKLREPIFEMLVHLEACLDHPEEELPSPLPSEFSERLNTAREQIEELASTYKRGKLIFQGPRICIAGLPNAGKSSLLNALLGRDRAIVSPIPGTTRDTIEETCEIGGISPVIIDTAGLRSRPENSIEEEGMRRAEEAVKNCDLALLVIDRSRPMSEEDEALNRRIVNTAESLGRRVISVLNKSDLPNREGKWAGVKVSALKREGIEELREALLKRLEGEVSSQGMLVTSLRHHEALLLASQEIAAAKKSVQDNPRKWEERVAFHLREAARLLGEILGESATDEVLGAVFSRFCVGK